MKRTKSSSKLETAGRTRVMALGTERVRVMYRERGGEFGRGMGGGRGKAKIEKEQRRRGEGEMKNAEMERMCVCKRCSNLLSSALYDQSLSAAYKTHTTGFSWWIRTHTSTHTISFF